jgi:O-antigen/teichoic acid export membrane protein
MHSTRPPPVLKPVTFINSAKLFLRSRFTSLMSNRLAKDTLTVSIANFLRLLLQAIYFVAIARTLGPRQYGEFVAISAVVGILTPFSGLGSPIVLLKSVSRDRGLLKTYWGNGLFLILLSGSLFSLLIVAIGPTFFGSQLLLSIACISISELVLCRIVELASFVFNALGRMKETALLNIYISLSRLICIIFLAHIKARPTVEDWCIALLCGSTVCAIYGFWKVARIERAGLDMARLKQELAESIFFAVGNSAATFYNDIDKSMLARLADLSSAGVYGAAYRVIDVSMAPIRAMTACSYAEFFRRGANGPAIVLAYARKLSKRAALFGVVIYVVLTVSAPALALVLGSSFRDSVEALRWLAVIPLLRAFHLFLGDALSGCGHNGSRIAVQVIVAVTNIGLNLFFIQRWGWRGAAWSSIMCDSLLLCGFALAFAVINRSARPSVSPGGLCLVLRRTAAAADD